MVVLLMVWAVVVSISLVTLVAYVIFFTVAAAKTAHRRNRPDPLAAELDAFLEELLGRSVTTSPSSRGPVTGPK